MASARIDAGEVAKFPPPPKIGALPSSGSSSVGGRPAGEAHASPSGTRDESLFELSFTEWSLSEASESEFTDSDVDEAATLPTELREQLSSRSAGKAEKYKRRLSIGHNEANFIDKIESFAFKQSMSDLSLAKSNSSTHALEAMLKKRNEEFMYLYELNSMLRSMSMGISHSAITQLAVSRSMGTQMGSSGMSKRAAYKLKKERRHSSSMQLGARNIFAELDKASAPDVDDLIRKAEVSRNTESPRRGLEFSGDIRSSPMPEARAGEPARRGSPLTQVSMSSLLGDDSTGSRISDGEGSGGSALKAKPKLTTVSIVNDINFNKSSKLTPRKLGTVQVTLQVPTGTLCFLDYAVRFFDGGKSKGAKKRAKMKRVICADKKPLRHPLHRFTSPELRQKALSSFQCILEYCHERDRSDGDNSRAYEHTKAMCTIGLETSMLRDEIYSQLVKQTNSSKKHAVYAWEMLASCLGCFVPSQQLQPFLARHLEETAQAGTEMSKWAKYCVTRLEKMAESSKRMFPPTNRELDFVLRRKAMITMFEFCNGKQKQIPVYSSTTVAEALEFLCTMMGIEDREGYSVFECYEITKEDGSVDHVERGLLLHEHVSNCLAKFEAFSKAVPEDKPRSTKLIVKKKLFLNPRTMSSDNVGNQLLFHQCCRSIRTGELPCNVEDAEILCALRLQASEGDFNMENFFAIQAKLMEYIPESLLKKEKNHDWCQAVIDQYGSMVGMSAPDAQSYYVRYCKELPLFGYHLFTVTYARDHIKWEMPRRIRIGVNFAGLYFFNTVSKKTYHHFAFGEIVSFHTTPEHLLLSFFSGRSITIYTSHGDEIVSLIIDYKYHELKKVNEAMHLNSMLKV